MIFATPTAADRFAPQLPADKIKAEHTACFNGSAAENEYIICAQKLLNIRAYDDMRTLLQTALMRYPKSTDSWNALGVLEHQCEHFAAAIAAFKKVLTFAKNSKTFGNLKASRLGLANKLREDKEFERALEVYAEIAKSDPQDIYVQHNMGTINHMQLSNFKAAIQTFKKIIQQQPEEPHTWLSLSNCYTDMHDAENMQKLFDKSKPYTIAHNAVATMQAVLHFQTDPHYKVPHIDDLPLMQKEAVKAFQANNIFRGFVSKLSKFKQENLPQYHLEEALPACYFMGDSHILSAAHLPLTLGGKSYRATPYLHGGKLFNLTQQHRYRSKYLLNYWANKVDTTAPLIISYGEIDCRAEGGFLSYFENNPDTDRDAFMRAQIKAYITYVQKVCPQKHIYTTSTPPLSPTNAAATPALLPVIALFNGILEEEVKQAKIGYIDLYNTLLLQNGAAKKGAHIDRIHLTPLAYKKAVEATA